MTWTHALTLAAEFCFVVFAVMGAFFACLLAAHAMRSLWRRVRVRHELTRVEKLSLEALARYRRDMRL